MFKFSLQSVLDLRERNEQIKMKEFGEAASAAQAIKDEIEQIKQKLVESDQKLNRDKRQGRFSIDHLRMAEAFRDRMKLAILKCEEELVEAEKLVTEKRGELIEATKSRKMLETLKEKESKSYWAKIAKREQAQMDEFAQQQFFKNT